MNQLRMTLLKNFKSEKYGAASSCCELETVSHSNSQSRTHCDLFPCRTWMSEASLMK